MNEPVIAADGYTYERAALDLQNWLQHSVLSPVTEQMMEYKEDNSHHRSTAFDRFTIATCVPPMP